MRRGEARWTVLTALCRLLEKAESCFSTESEASLSALFTSSVFFELTRAFSWSEKVFWIASVFFSRSCRGVGASRRLLADAC